MNKINKIKRRIFLKIHGNRLSSILEKINLIVFHWEERMKMVSYGNEDYDTVYFIIRPRGIHEGIISTYFYVAKEISWALDKGYIPIVDFDDDKCQYYVRSGINGIRNAWEYYFEQPMGISPIEVMKKKNVLYSGWSFRKKYQIPNIEKSLSGVRDGKTKELCNKWVRIKSEIYDMAESYYNEYFKGGEVLGVFIRGTDYVALKPKNHPKQPNISDVIEKIDEFLRLYNVCKLYVVTEDASYYKLILKKYKKFIISTDSDYVENYKGKDYVSSSYTYNDNIYEKNLNYIIRLLLLSRCDFLISSIASGSLLTKCIKKDKYKDEFWFELGNY